MVKKGLVREESPEKMPSVTTGIQMTRGKQGSAGSARERLTGGNEPADEATVAKMVTEYIQSMK
jgi:hypothetical protein